MIKYLAVLGLMLVLGSMGLIIDDDNQALAISGCCKKRSSTNSPWRKVGTDLQRCKVENREDGDNVFKKSGLVWWDMAC